MEILKAFRDFITKEKLFAADDRLLVAVSGGLDSVVLCALCHQAGFDLTLAHCNFRLRGEESQRDEDFVRRLAARYNLPLLVRTFDTMAYATEFRLSVQVAARELRYNWFRDILAEWKAERPSAADAPALPAIEATALPAAEPPATEATALSASAAPALPATGATAADAPVLPATDAPPPIPAVSRNACILTAHHLDDNVETLLMNFFKGTGIAGLRAMLPRQGDIVRPLLFAERSALHQFALAQGLEWVEDSSNLSDKYTRNFFRHQVIPLIQQVYPSAVQNLAENIDRFRDMESIYRQVIEQQKQRLLEQRGNEWLVPVLKLKKSEPLTTLVYELIKPFGFTAQQTGEVIGLLDSGSGKYVCSATFRVLKDRSWLIFSPLETTAAANILIEAAPQKISYQQGELWLELLSAEDAGDLLSQGPPAPKPAKGHAGKSPAPDQLIALLDAADIRYPLLLRKWRQGDYFYPLGMPKKKKIARFLIDNKLSLADKEKVWVLEMDKKIIWVVGKRIDHRWRIGPGTKKVLKIEWRPA
jgi:tRNA(Ile)-lysidine synthase